MGIKPRLEPVVSVKDRKGLSADYPRESGITQWIMGVLFIGELLKGTVKGGFGITDP